jgi:copper chaperone NosL
MRGRRALATACFSGLFLWVASLSLAADLKPRQAGPADKCPVCGMFVAKYPDFAAQVQFRDGSVLHFDGAKDLFKWYHNLPGFSPGRKRSDIAALYVTGYYDLAPVDGQAAWYVTGSTVYGPMGQELIPFRTQQEARQFMKDHTGKALLRFTDVTPAILKRLDR